MAKTVRQERFIREYLVDRNGAASARRAGYSPRSANEIARQLLIDPEIQQAIADLEAERAKRADLDADALIAETHRIAYDVSESGRVRLRALEMLLNLAGKVVDRREHTGTIEHRHTMTPELRRRRVEDLLARGLARRAVIAPNGNGNGNGNGHAP